MSFEQKEPGPSPLTPEEIKELHDLIWERQAASPPSPRQSELQERLDRYGSTASPKQGK